MFENSGFYEGEKAGKPKHDRSISDGCQMGATPGEESQGF